MFDFTHQLDLFKKKDHSCLFNAYLEKKGVQNPKIIPTKESLVIGGESGNTVSGWVIARYFNNTYYVGEMKDGERHGFGHRSYVNNDLIYEGDYVRNKKCGTGKLWSESRKMWVFDGHWNNDMKNGFGEMWKEKASYLGNWVDDKMEGVGKMKWSDGQEYEGHFQQDFRHGEGTMTFVNGDKYTGTFKAGKLDGKGFYEWNSGEVYEGSLYDGTMDGNGNIRYQLPVCGTGNLKMGSIHDLNFNLQTMREWEEDIQKSSYVMKSYRSQILPTSAKDLDDSQFRLSSKNIGSSNNMARNRDNNQTTQTRVLTEGRSQVNSENFPMNQPIKETANSEIKKVTVVSGANTINPPSEIRTVHREVQFA